MFEEFLEDFMGEFLESCCGALGAIGLIIGIVLYIFWRKRK